MILGVMQGRLLPKYQGRYQAHPLGYWRDEFPATRRLGLGAVEFILDRNDYEKNPLMSAAGLDEIREASAETGIAVRSVCADYFMEAPLHVADREAAAHSLGVLKTLVANTAALGCSDVVIPCVDQSSLGGSPDNGKRFVEAMDQMAEDVAKAGIRLALETDLAPEPFAKLLDEIVSERVTVNYDIGNSASQGFNHDEEFDAYGERITDVHIKDRPRGEGSVVLGSGDANIEGVFDRLRNMAFDGPLIMQAYRDDEGVAIFREQLKGIAPLLKEYFGIELQGGR